MQEQSFPRSVPTSGFSDLNKVIDVHSDDLGNGGAAHNYEITIAEGLRGQQPAQTIHFQDGAVKEVGLNGISDETLLAIVADRLQCFQKGPFSCRENAVALTHLETAMLWLNKRTLDRMQRGVEGKHEK